MLSAGTVCVVERRVDGAEGTDGDAQGFPVDQALEDGLGNGQVDLGAGAFRHGPIDDHLGVEDKVGRLSPAQAIERDGFLVPAQVAAQNLDDPDLAEIGDVIRSALEGAGCQLEKARARDLFPGERAEVPAQDDETRSAGRNDGGFSGGVGEILASQVDVRIVEVDRPGLGGGDRVGESGRVGHGRMVGYRLTLVGTGVGDLNDVDAEVIHVQAV